MTALALLKGSDYEGRYYSDDFGRPVALTTGKWLVVYAPLADAEALVRGAIPREHPEASLRELPPVASVVRLLRDARLAPQHYRARIDEGTQPDAERAAQAREGRKARALRYEEHVATAAARVAEAVAAPRHSRWGALSPARKRLAEAKRELREIQRAHDPAEHAVLCGEATFDLTILRTALKAMGAKRGDLVGTGDIAKQAILVPDGKSAVALVMPYRVRR